MQRLDYFIKRLLLIIPTFIGITFLVFALCQIVPGGPVEQALAARRSGGKGESGGGSNKTGTISPEQVAKLREQFGFDKPLLVRYGNWLWHQRLGLNAESYKYRGSPSWKIIISRFRVSLIFGITGFVLTYLICIPLGISKALRDGGPFDMVSSLIIFSGYALPAFAFGMLLKLVFCGTVEGDIFKTFNFFPVYGFHSDNYEQLSTFGRFRDVAWHMVLPVTCYVIGNFAVMTLLMKNSLLEQISQDYVRTVLAKGASKSRAIWVHALRNSLIPIATGIGGILTVMFAGSVLIEKVFEIPGMGKLSLEALVSRDYALFMAIMTITSILGLLGNVLQDLCYVVINPRINFDKN